MQLRFWLASSICSPILIAARGDGQMSGHFASRVNFVFPDIQLLKFGIAR